MTEGARHGRHDGTVQDGHHGEKHHGQPARTHNGKVDVVRTERFHGGTEDEEKQHAQHRPCPPAGRKPPVYEHVNDGCGEAGRKSREEQQGNAALNRGKAHIGLGLGQAALG